VCVGVMYRRVSSRRVFLVCFLGVGAHARIRTHAHADLFFFPLSHVHIHTHAHTHTCTHTHVCALSFSHAHTHTHTHTHFFTHTMMVRVKLAPTQCNKNKAIPQFILNGVSCAQTYKTDDNDNTSIWYHKLTPSQLSKSDAAIILHISRLIWISCR